MSETEMEKTLTRKEKKIESRIDKVNYWVERLRAEVHGVVNDVLPYSEVQDSIKKGKKRARYHIRVLAKYGTWDDEANNMYKMAVASLEAHLDKEVDATEEE